MLVLGLAYKANIDDDRESPSYEIIELLQESGAQVDYCDPYFPVARKTRKYDVGLRSVPLDAGAFAALRRGGGRHGPRAVQGPGALPGREAGGGHPQPDGGDRRVVGWRAPTGRSRANGLRRGRAHIEAPAAAYSARASGARDVTKNFAAHRRRLARRAAAPAGHPGHRQPARRRGRSRTTRSGSSTSTLRRSALFTRVRALRPLSREAAPRPGGGPRRTTCRVCSPNYLHDAHFRLALRVGADAICEKPLVINPWNLDALAGARARDRAARPHHPPAARASGNRSRCASSSRRQPPARRTRSCLTYVTARGRWYDVSWKGQREKSGGLATNIGIHFFDMLIWLFGRVADARGAPATSRGGWRASSSSSARACAGSSRSTATTCPSRRSPGEKTTLPLDHRRRQRDRVLATASPICTRASTSATLAGTRLRDRGRAAVDRARRTDSANARPRVRAEHAHPIAGVG